MLAFNETGFNGTADDAYRTQGWNFLLSGGGLYGNLDFSFTAGHEDGTDTPRFTGNYNAGGSAAIRAQLAILLRFMQSLPLEAMHPQNDVIVGGADGWRALAAPGKAYAAWLPGDGPVAPVVAVPKGQWRAEWVDILTGAVTTECFTQTTWISTLHGVRRGGGVALRIVPADATQPVGRIGDQGDSAAGGAAPATPASLVLEDFESYASSDVLAKAWYQPPHGAWMKQSLEPAIKAGGRYSLKFEHRLSGESGKDYAAICILKKWDLSPYNAVRFWLKPDGSGREVTIQFNIADAKGNNIHDLWQTTYRPDPGDASPRLVTIPFSELRHPGWLDLKGRSAVFLPQAVIELALYVGAGAHHYYGEGAYYFDDIRAVSVPLGFDEQAAKMLELMRQHATEHNITGVAVVGYFEGDRIASLRSRALVVDRLTDPAKVNAPGANLLAIAYAKATEMAETHRPSGSHARPTMLGEVGWQGGMVARGESGYWIAAFSGGKSEDDAELSRKALSTLGAGWQVLQ